MQHVLNTGLDEYVSAHTTNEPLVLSNLVRQTNLEVLMPRMVSGNVQGQLLKFISQMVRPLNILEIGTFTGYSAICLCAGLLPGGKLTTIDKNPELERVFTKAFEQAQCLHQIDYKFGNAIDLLPSLTGPFDLVFIDADKINNANYYNLIFTKVPVGGYILVDNVLWSGKVMEPMDKMDKETLAVYNFNDMIQQDARVENILLPIRDGLMLIRKLADGRLA